MRRRSSSRSAAEGRRESHEALRDVERETRLEKEVHVRRVVPKGSDRVESEHAGLLELRIFDGHLNALDLRVVVLGAELGNGQQVVHVQDLGRAYDMVLGVHQLGRIATDECPC